ncbi:MAG: nucleotidyl transferase AbiEii/AbiGii toxin family protein [Deltaproteobacteria bacterium]|nr:nucleotidyl transferase AbiEii/AbiGii toxin family protein [Deltaproteobacteria bacterium]
MNQAKIQGEDFNLLLVRYGIERLLYRLSISSHADEFVLKGASLFLVWKGQSYRVTRDADLLGFGSADTERISTVFIEVCLVSYDDDGVRFKPDTVRAMPIREEQEYEGIRVTLEGVLHRARIPLQIDIGFGDVITPAPEEIEFPTLLDAPAPRLRAYPRYTMVAEKFEAMVRLGMANSRMKDFYDVWLLSRLFEFNGRLLCEAVRNTLRRRSTSIPDGLPTAFTEEFWQDPQKQTQWQAFVRKAKPEPVASDFDTLISDIIVFLKPVIESLLGNNFIKKTWEPGGPWK